MTERVEVVKIEEGARYAIVVNGVPADYEADFADYISRMMENWTLSNQQFLVLTAPSGLELKFEKVEPEE